MTTLIKGEKSSSNMSGNTFVDYPTPLLITSGVSCSLSIVGAIIIFVTYFIVPEIKNTTRKLFTLLTIADFLTPLGILSSVVFYKVSSDVDDYNQFCTFQSAITTYSSMVSFIFTVAIAFHLFCTVYAQPDWIESSRFLIVVCVICWGLPGLIVSQALSYDMLGRVEGTTTGPWCWIKCNPCNNMKSIVYMLVTGKFWELLAYMLTIIFYGLLKWQLVMRHEGRSFREISSDLRKEDRNFLYVWLVFILIRISGTIRFFLNFWPAETRWKGDKVLQYMQAFGDPSQALFNCIIFCLLDKTVRAYILQKIRGIRLSEFLTSERYSTINENGQAMGNDDYNDDADARGSYYEGIDAGPSNTEEDTHGLANNSGTSYGSCRTGAVRAPACLGRNTLA